MFIVRTTTQDEIKIDYDELELIPAAGTNDLIYFRQGAVLKRMISVIVEDKELEREIPRIPGQKKSLKEHRSKDIFEGIRSTGRQSLPETNQQQLP